MVTVSAQKTDIKAIKNNNLKYFIASFLFVFLLLFSVLMFIENETRNAHLETTKINEERIVSLENDYLGKEMTMIIGDLNYLNNAHKNRLLDSANYADIAESWKEFSIQRGIYDQIRFIDASGDEQIRINMNETGSYIVVDSELQNKKDRYYFQETSQLPENTINISKIDLNMENGEIEQPYKPMIRFSSAVYDENQNFKGVIVLNYLAESVMKSFRDLAVNSLGEVVLLNSDGYWISSTDPDQEWNFMFENKKDQTFQKLYPDEWELIKKGNSQEITNSGLFTYSAISLENKIADPDKQDVQRSAGELYIVSSVLKDGEQSSIFSDDFWMLAKDIFKKNALYFLMGFVIAMTVGLLVLLNRNAYSKIKYYSEFDSLTKIFNRRAGIEKLNQMFSLDNRRKSSISLCFIDVNGLKQVNDILGHNRGDELIVSVTEAIKKAIREDDFVMRLGGDEFLIVFNNTEIDEAEQIWARIVSSYQKINDNEDRPYLISVSHGIVSRNNSEKSEVDDLIKLADERMYEEKRIIKENFDVIK